MMPSKEVTVLKGGIQNKDAAYLVQSDALRAKLH